MKNTVLSFLMILFISSVSFSQNQKVFNPAANAKSDLSAAIKKADNLGKHIIVKIGYNQCPWCIMLHKFLKEDPKIDSILNADYVMVKVNYSKENWNLDVMKSLKFPQRFGFPVLVILDSNGNLLHTQNTLYLEKGKSYDSKRIIDFLKKWNKKALDPKSYIK